MQFHVGPYTYTLVISDREIFDENGERLEGCAVENRRLLIIARSVEPERREEIAMHEFTHAWGFHVPAPHDEEERAQLGATIARQFQDDLDAAGGRETLEQLPAVRVPHLTGPLPFAAKAGASKELADRTDRRTCGGCETETMCGDIQHGAAVMPEGGSRMVIERWFRCAVCGVVQVWWEFCFKDGSPSGEFLSVPKPKILRGAEAGRWMADHAEAALA